MSSRSFGKMVSDLQSLEEAVASYTARAAEKLRQQNSRAGGIYVFIRTNRFRQNDPQYSNAAMVGFDDATSDTASLIRAAMGAIRHIYRAGYRYHKAGVMLTDLTAQDGGQMSLLNPDPTPDETRQGQDKRMAVLDRINTKMGQGTLFHATEGITLKGKKGVNIYGRRIHDPRVQGTERWRMRSQFKSPAYTTRWNELVKAK